MDLICVGCPMGCMLDITQNGSGVSVKNNQCAIGEKYAREELTDPRRNVASSVRVRGGDYGMCSVKTSAPLPKGMIFDLMKEVRKTTVNAPVSLGDVIIRDFAGTGVDVLATRDVSPSA